MRGVMMVADAGKWRLPPAMNLTTIRRNMTGRTWQSWHARSMLYTCAFARENLQWMKAFAVRKWKAYSELIQLTTWCQSSWRHNINCFWKILYTQLVSCSWWVELSTTTWVPFAACASTYPTNGLWTLPGSGVGFVWAMWVIWFGAWRDWVIARVSVPSLLGNQRHNDKHDKHGASKRPFMEKVEVHPEPEPHSQLSVRFASVGWWLIA